MSCLPLTPCFSGVRRASLFLLTVLTVFLVRPVALRAQTPDDYFHGGATNYVFGEKEKAKEQIVTGLQSFPRDPKLNQLLVLLKKEEEQKQQQQQQQQQQNKKDEQKDQKQNQDSQKKDSDQKKDQNQSNDQKKEQEKKRQEQAKKNADQKKEQQKKEQEKQNAEQKKQEKADQNDQQEPQPTYAAGQMTPQQAKQLLDAQKGDEMVIPIRPQVKPRDQSKPLKDW